MKNPLIIAEEKLRKFILEHPEDKDIESMKKELLKMQEYVEIIKNLK